MIKKVIIWIIIVATFLLVIFIGKKAIFCKINGLNHRNAIKIANEKLEIDFNKVPFILKNEQFENIDKSWIFTYHKGGCVVDVIVDRYGVSDIGGMSEECLSYQKRQGNRGVE